MNLAAVSFDGCSSKEAGAKANDYNRMQVWAGQSAAMAKAILAGDLVRDIWRQAQILLRDDP